MKILAFAIMFMFGLYFYYKTKFFRSRRPYERELLTGKTSLTLGLFVSLFGTNTMLLFSEIATYIVGSLFIVIGLASIRKGYLMIKHFTPLARQEAAEENTR